MVIRKPYAFLIKNFRLIHGLLFIMLLFLFIKTFVIFGFFSDYVANETYTITANFTNSYVSPLMYIVAVLAIIISFIIYYILQVKDKGNIFYLLIVVYYIILFVFFIYYHSVFIGLEEKGLARDIVRNLRDISLIALLPQIVAIFIIFARTLGFNLKQFDFKRDLEELQIDSTDNEEVEVTLGNDSYKIARFFRKTLRLTKYFIIENKMFVIGSISAIIFIISIVIYSSIDVYGVKYAESQEINSNMITYNIKDSYITNTDINNLVITDGKYYVLADIVINNKSPRDYTFDKYVFSLMINGKAVNPTFSYSEKFFDIGVNYEPTEIKSGEDREYIVVFEYDTAKYMLTTYQKEGIDTANT